MDCKNVDEVLFLWLDEDLATDVRQPVQDHLAHCPACARRLDKAQKVLVLVRQRCIRQAAPQRLRIRILSSLPHRQGWC